MRRPMRQCSHCGNDFFKRTSLHKYCSAACAIAVIAKDEIDRAIIAPRKPKIAPTQKPKPVKNKSYYQKKLQTVFNKYIRMRDMEDPCISCGKVRAKYHAGHYLSVGGYPELRFNENNVHKQCAHCNIYLSGNLLNYRMRLINKIGLKEIEILESIHPPKKYVIDDLILLTSIYKAKVDEMVLECSRIQSLQGELL